MLIKKGVIDLFDYIVSCEEVHAPKPDPAVYLYCCLRARVSPKETIIIEDSQVGRKAAFFSGCHVLAVETPENVTLKNILNAIQSINKKQTEEIIKVKWRNPLTVVIPMNKRSGHSSSINHQDPSSSERPYPAYLTTIDGIPIIQHVVENLNVDAQFIFIVPKEDYEQYQLQHMFAVLSPKCSIVVADHDTEGQAASILLAKDLINNSTPILIAGSAQLLDWDSNSFLFSMDDSQVDGGIVTFTNTHPRYSYVITDEKNKVIDIAERKPISNQATAGIFYWARGSDYVKFAEQLMKDESKKVNDAFYVSMVYKEALEAGFNIRATPCARYWPLGQREDVEALILEHSLEKRSYPMASNLINPIPLARYK